MTITKTRKIFAGALTGLALLALPTAASAQDITNTQPPPSYGHTWIPCEGASASTCQSACKAAAGVATWWTGNAHKAQVSHGTCLVWR
ncbi:MAG: hypothetical protein AB7L84_00945 [Acidimicrobiia bacterium]